MFDVKLFTIRSLIKPGSSDDAGDFFNRNQKSNYMLVYNTKKKMHLIKKVLENININFISEIKSKTWKPI